MKIISYVWLIVCAFMTIGYLVRFIDHPSDSSAAMLFIETILLIASGAIVFITKEQ